MQYRMMGKTGYKVSEVSFGAWAIGGTWGEVDDAQSVAALEEAVEQGVNFFDTADVYGDGRSESIIGSWLRDNPDAGVTVATKMGRRAKQLHENFVAENFRAWTDRSRRNLGVDTLDLVQLHCPPTAVFSNDEMFDALDALVDSGAIANYGVSVETVDEALAAIARPHVASVQIIINAFRLKPLDAVLPAAAEAGVGIIARVPLASGLLSGRYTHDTAFPADDHRNFNRHGEAFDQGETFSGVDYAEGVEAAREFSALAEKAGLAPATAALAWVAQLPGVSTVIPGARNVAQAEANAAAGSVPELGEEFTQAIRELYDRRFRAAIHDRW